MVRQVSFDPSVKARKARIVLELLEDEGIALSDFEIESDYEDPTFTLSLELTAWEDDARR